MLFSEEFVLRSSRFNITQSRLIIQSIRGFNQDVNKSFTLSACVFLIKSYNGLFHFLPEHQWIHIIQVVFQGQSWTEFNFGHQKRPIIKAQLAIEENRCAPCDAALVCFCERWLMMDDEAFKNCRLFTWTCCVHSPWTPLQTPCCCWACAPSAWWWGRSYCALPESPHECGSYRKLRHSYNRCADSGFHGSLTARYQTDWWHLR